MLCRVFHKSKEDNTSSKLMYEYDTTPQSLTLASSSPTNQTMPGGYNRFPTSFTSSMSLPTHHHHHHHFNSNQNSSFMDLLHFSRDTNANNTIVTQISSKGDDGYGFLWDMDLEENSLEDAVASNLDAITFEIDNNNKDNNMVCL